MNDRQSDASHPIRRDPEAEDPRATMRAVVIRDYRRPYDDPIAVRRGDTVSPDKARTEKTDFIGWTWCAAADGREGWVPDGWLDRSGGAYMITRDFSALELTVAALVDNSRRSPKWLRNSCVGGS